MLTLEIVTPTKKITGPVKVPSVTIPGAAGEMTILPGHAKLVSTLDTGVLRFQADGKESKTAAVISSGFVAVENDRVIVLAETLEMAQQLDAERARRAQTKAEERLKEKDLSPEAFRKYQLKLQRALIRQQVAAEHATKH